ncbi:MAG: RnfABCDGE type electron transport complex subunit D [Bulleidia sp.]|nr:RnfABCDGE type electron transport complex subunit D [Bulleidia sp.]
MKFTFKPSPNYRSAQSTTGIMKDLTECLLAVTLFSVIYYCQAYGAKWGLRVIAMMAAAVATALICDALWFKARKSADIENSVRTSYSWVTAMILVLISPVKASVYSIIVCTAVAVVFGKLVFGGFGQNIFNPAAFGEAVLMNNFASTYSEDFTTSATPTVAAKGLKWLVSDASFYDTYGGLGGMFMGSYASTIGSTCALLLILCAVFLIWNKDIDWQVPVTYILTVFVLSLILALMKSLPASYAVFSVLAGGVMFGAVFMMTDPVTSPVTLPGRVVFAIGAGMLTFLIRLKSNLSDGVLYSILLMNMLVPAIDKLFDGSQIKDAKAFQKKVCIFAVIFLAIGVAVGASAKPAEAEETAAPASSGTAASIALNGDFADNEATCTDNGDGSYSCSAKGFGLINNMGEGYANNEAAVTVKDGAVVSVEVTTFGDTAGVGDMATSADALKAYEGKTLDDSVDATSGATFTSNSVASMVSAALNMAAGN